MSSDVRTAARAAAHPTSAGSGRRCSARASRCRWRRRDRLAGLLDPPQRLRPRPDRARRVRAGAAARPAGRAARRPAAARRRVVFVSSLARRGRRRRCCSSSRSHGAHQLWQFVALAALTGATGALGNPAAALARCRSSCPTELLTGALALRSIARPGGDDRRAGARRPALRDPAGGGLRRPARCSLVSALAARCSPSRARTRSCARAGAAAACRASSPACASSARRRSSSARSRSTSSRCSSAERSRCCRCSRKSILHTGPFGLGVLRSAIAVGALVAGVRLARRPLGGRAGRTLLARRRHVRREHGRLRPLALVLAVGARARGQRVRRHVSR